MKYQIDDTITQKGRNGEHTYTLAGTRMLINARGYPVTLLVWRGTCATCGCQFQAETGTYTVKPNRNCPEHVQRRFAPRHD
jgi:hypothetical protein